jgi:hypothetical protein
VFGEVAAFGVSPFVVSFGDDGADRRSTAASLAKIPTTRVRRLISPLARSAGWWTRSCASALRERAERQHVVAGIREHGGGVGKLAGEHGDDLVELLEDVAGVGLA